MQTTGTIWLCALAGAAALSAAAQSERGPFRAESFFPGQMEIAVRQDGADAVVTWNLEGDRGEVGFNVFRASGPAGEPERINADFLYAAGEYGGRYEYRDSPPAAGRRYVYRVEVVFADGSRARSDPAALAFKRTKAVPRAAKAPRFSAQPSALSADDLAQAALAGVELQRAALRRSQNVGSRIKIAVKDPGVYRLDAANIAARLGATTDEVREWIGQDFLRLSSQGAKCSWIPDLGNDGLYFYNPGYEDLYTFHNVFWLERESQGLTVPPRQGNPPAEAFAPMTVWRTARFEVQRLQQYMALHKVPLDDYWFWITMTAKPVPVASNVVFAVNRIDTNAAEARLDLHLQGASSNPHHVYASVNGMAIGEALFTNLVPHAASFPVAVGVLSNGNNVLSLKAALDTGVSASTVLLDNFSLTYRMHAESSNDYLQLPVAETTNQCVGGFTTNDIHVAEILDARRIRAVEDVRADPATGGRYNVSFSAATNGNLGYVAFTRAGALTNMTVEGIALSSLRATTNQADYLLIAHPVLAEQARRLADFRAGQIPDLQTRTVSVTDVYDEFSHGLATPAAIHRFLAYVAGHWTAPAPQYLLFAGSSSMDYKNHLGYNGSLVPMEFTDTPYGPYSADNLLADVTGDDGVPEFSLGRIPAHNSVQLSNIVDKLVLHENPALRPATNRAFVCADDPDLGGDFHASADRVAAVVPASYLVGKSYLKSPATNTEIWVRAAVSNAFHVGTGLFIYFGHSAWDRLAGEGIFRNADVLTLSNSPVFPIALLGTCWASRHEWPGQANLYFGKPLMLATNKGALATWGPSSETFNDDHETMTTLFLQNHAAHPALRLGDACRVAVQQAATRAWTASTSKP